MIRSALTTLCLGFAAAVACGGGGDSRTAGNGDSGVPVDGGADGSGGAAGGSSSGAGGNPACDCVLGSSVPVCGVDGETYDAACGRECVPVAIECDGACPCATGTGGGGSGECSENCASSGLECCEGRCANTGNDPANCGACGTQCSGATSYCNSGTCVEPPCDSGTTCAAGETCCGMTCCTGAQLCCLIMGGPWYTECADPVDGTCPVGCPLCVCADPDTPVSTPTGERRIADLRVGDLVYTVDQNGVTVAPIVETRKTPVQNHRVVRVELSSGRILDISGPHPTVDGRSFSDLTAGDTLDGTRIVDVRQVAYRHAFTYDILPASDTGAYFAAGVAIGSTLTQVP
jgi:hypothetical protein